MEIRICPVDAADAEAVAVLAGELGYPASAAAMAERIRNLVRLRDRAVFVAHGDGAVVGWIDIGIVHHLQAEPAGEIGGLVVSQACRNAGVGARLVRRAEEWTRDRGVMRIIVRSNIVRDRAHGFYLREGYERTKTSAVFSKVLEAPQS